MSEDEIAIMDGGRCILQLRGVRPFFSEKFDITKHPHYKYLADADKKNTFDVDRFLSTLRRKRQQVVAQDESFDRTKLTCRMKMQPNNFIFECRRTSGRK